MLQHLANLLLARHLISPKWTEKMRSDDDGDAATVPAYSKSEPREVILVFAILSVFGA